MNSWEYANDDLFFYLIISRQGSQNGEEKTFSDSSLLENLQSNHVSYIETIDIVLWNQTIAFSKSKDDVLWKKINK